ncbi:hypothetical protein GQ457_10G003350 [Hibiscus cannabinus]
MDMENRMSKMEKAYENIKTDIEDRLDRVQLDTQNYIAKSQEDMLAKIAAMLSGNPSEKKGSVIIDPSAIKEEHKQSSGKAPMASEAPVMNQQVSYPESSLPGVTIYDVHHREGQGQDRAGSMAKRALLVGCNYEGTRFSLRGCIHDADTIGNLIVSELGFEMADVKVLTDGPRSSVLPTGKNIKSALREMVTSARPGDVLFFYFSGHGTTLPAFGRDRFREEEAIGDKTLKFKYSNAKEVVIPEDKGILMSGCEANQTSFDVVSNGKAYGAFTHAVAVQQVVNKHSESGESITNKQLVGEARQVLRDNGFEQLPCLYCDKSNANAPFLGGVA